jgi:nucleotide-binding universal stress UspA family protein
VYEFRRILVPTDFSANAEEALELAVYYGERFEAEITLLHVDEFAASPMGARKIVDDDLRRYQARKEIFFEEQFTLLREALRGRSVTLVPQVLGGRAYKVIVEEGERLAYDLIVIATRGLTPLSSYLIGGTAERVVRLSRQPVLSVAQGPKRQGQLSSILCPTDFSPAGNAALSYALSVARQNNAALFIHYIAELDKPETEEELRRRVPDLHEHHPEAGQVTVQYIFDRDLEPSNSIIRFAEDRDVDLIIMSKHGRKGLRRVYVGNNTAEVVRQSTRPVLTVSHPFHKRIFSRPLTAPASHALPTT